MRPLDVGLSDEAIEEARAAFTWYGERNPRAAAQFLFELDEAIGSIAEFPDAWPPYLDGTRRKLLRRFPFALVYRMKGERLQVIAARTNIAGRDIGSTDKWLPPKVSCVFSSERTPRGTPEQAFACLAPYEDELTIGYKVSSRVNRPKNNDAGLVEEMA